MNRGVLLAVCLAIALGGCDRGLLRTNKNADIVFRCKTVVEGTAADRVVKYKPIEVIKGGLRGEMLDGDGFLNYRSHLKEGEDVGEIYTFRLWGVPKDNHLIPTEDFPFGCNCDLSVELELADGKGDQSL